MHQIHAMHVLHALRAISGSWPCSSACGVRHVMHGVAALVAHGPRATLRVIGTLLVRFTWFLSA